MSCYICGMPIDDMKIDFRDMKTAPCGTCEVAIQECLDGFGDPDPDEYEVELTDEELEKEIKRLEALPYEAL